MVGCVGINNDLVNAKDEREIKKKNSATNRKHEKARVIIVK